MGHLTSSDLSYIYVDYGLDPSLSADKDLKKTDKTPTLTEVQSSIEEPE